MYRLLLITLIFNGFTLKAKTSTDSLILTLEENNKWLLRLEKVNSNEQLELIRQRILLDTNIYINQYFADRITIDNETPRGNRIEGQGRLLLIFNGYPAEITNKTKTESIIKLSQFLNTKSVKDIQILKDIQAQTLYGSRAYFGVILMTTTDNTFRKIKEIEFNNN